MKTRTKLLLAVIITMAFSALLAFSVVSTVSASKPSVDCISVPVSQWGNGKVISQKWEVAGSGSACLTVVWEKQGSVLMAGGVFTAPLSLNGRILSTTVVAGQLAPQIVQFRRIVSAGESWEFRPTWLASGTEVVLGFDYESLATATPTPTNTPTVTRTPTISPSPTTRVWRLWMPMILRPLPLLEEVREVRPSSELQIIYHKWSNAIREQKTCMKVDFVGGYDNALIESGWIFGSSLEAMLNGNPLEIPTLPQDGDVATQLGSVRLPIAQTLRVCVTGTGTGNEIGLRIRYPAP